MTENPQLSEQDAAQLLQLLRQKQENWVEWGKACQQLQKAGYTPQTLFEETGFEPVHQNQVIVAAQVYESLVQAEVSEAVRSHFAQKGSDVLYEFRLLSRDQRAAAATLAAEKNFNQEDAHEVARAIKDYSRLPKVPEGFTDHPGDAVAYQCWKLARGKKDLQARSRLIARGFQFAHSTQAREQLEKLLSDFNVVPVRPAPNLPIYRLESEEQLPRLVAVVDSLQVTHTEIEAAPNLETQAPFGIAKLTDGGTWVALPGWQALLNAVSPVAICCQSHQLPPPLSDRNEPLLVVVDRADTEWNPNAYFLVEQQERLELQWFETAPDLPLLGRVILVLRPKRVLDEEAIVSQSWDLDE